MEQVTEALEIGIAVLIFCLGILVGKSVWKESCFLYDALEKELRLERCVEERTYE